MLPVRPDSLRDGFFDLSPLPLLIVELATHRIVECNPAAAKTLGFALPAEIVGKGIPSLSPPMQDDGTSSEARAAEFYERARAGGPVVFEWRFSRAKANPWKTQVTMQRFQTGGSELLQLSFLDMSADDAGERNTVQSELHHAQTLLIQTIEQSPVPMALASAADFQFKIINKAAEDFLLIRAADHLNKTFSEIEIVWQEYAPDGRKIAVEELPLPRALRGLATSGMEMMLKRSDGSTVWLVASGVPIHDASGKLLAGLLVMQDITERKRFEEQVLANERRFRELIRNSSDSVTVLAADGTQLFVSDVVEQMLGFSRAELLNIPVMDLLIHPEDRESVKAAFGRLISEGEVLTEYRHQRKDGSWAWLEARGTNQLNNPDIRGVVLNVRDITERKRIQEALNNVQKLEALGVLAAGIAHDFNNLMAGLFGFLDLARLSSADPTVVEYLEKANGAIERARGLTHQLLTFSKGGAPVQKTAPLFPFVNETVRFALSGSNISCRFDVPDDLRACQYDRSQIGQVIDNVIINALQAMPLGGSIDVSARNTRFRDGEHPPLAGGDYVMLSVRDGGIGIPRDLLPRIFDPFFTTKSRGHGLGLATSYSIMKRHGGGIEAESEPGKGTVFHLYLPAVPLAGAASEGVPGETHKGNGIILVMDDEEVVRESLSRLLKTFGYDTVVVEDGQRAVDYVTAELQASRTPVALVFDLTVQGGMGGREALNEIRKRFDGIPAFVVSGYADDPVIRNPRDYGFVASLCKPFTREELGEVLGKHLSRKGVPRLAV